MNNFHLYIIKCKDNYLYVGITDDIEKRISQHKDGFCRNTKNRGIIQLAYTESFKERSEAAKREKEIKGWRREKKEQLLK
ncbi:MAG: GIY-YIG nuclease family protein [Patescibacteria group bacterium]